MFQLLAAIYERLLYRYVILMVVLLCILAAYATSEQIAFEGGKAVISISLGLILALFFRPLDTQLHEHKDGFYWSAKSSDYSPQVRFIAVLLYGALVFPISFGLIYFGLAAMSFGALSLLIVLIIERIKNRPLYARRSVNNEN